MYVVNRMATAKKTESLDPMSKGNVNAKVVISTECFTKTRKDTEAELLTKISM